MTLTSTQWRGSVTLFHDIYHPAPCEEILDASWDDIASAINFQEPIPINKKDNAKVFLPCALKELLNSDGVMEKIRSKDHVIDAKILVTDIDGLSEANFRERLEKLKADNVTFRGFTTFSQDLKPDMRVRILVPLDRPVDNREYTAVSVAFDAKYFNGADPSGTKMYQAQAVRCCHPERQSQTWENTAGLLSVEDLLTVLPEQFPSADINKIADACQQIRAFRDNRGAGQSEPLWFDSLGITVHCVDGENISQTLSSGHAEYNEHDTAKKIERRLKAAPTTCAQFKQSNPEGCVGCTQTCHSRIPPVVRINTKREIVC